MEKSLSAITNRSWVPLFFPVVLARACVRVFAQKTKTKKKQPTDCRGPVCDHCTESPYSSMSVCGPHHTVAIINIFVLHFSSPRIQRSIWAVFTLGGQNRSGQLGLPGHGACVCLCAPPQTPDRNRSAHRSHSQLRLGLTSSDGCTGLGLHRGAPPRPPFTKR